jgi:hypothetical protein
MGAGNLASGLPPRADNSVCISIHGAAPDIDVAQPNTMVEGVDDSVDIRQRR